jgi:methionyl-tRNA formyltransferase
MNQFDDANHDTVPIKSAAEQLGISVYQTDRFKDFDVSSVRQDINLIVAVSFGLLIPAKVIQGANYGGINVHPSLLPEYELGCHYIG